MSTATARALGVLITVALLGLGAQAQDLTPIEAEERGVLQSPQGPSPARSSSGLSLRTLGDVLLIPRGGLPGSDQSLMVLDADTGDLIDANFIAFTEHTSAPNQAILNFEGDGIFVSTQANTTGNVVYQYDLDGNFLGVFAPAGGPNLGILQNIRGIRLDPTGTRLWVTVASGANFSSIAEFDTEGNYLGNFAGWPESPVGHPWSILVRESDVLISSGGYPNSIHRFEFDGTYLGVWNQHPLYSPQQLALAANGNVLNAAFQPQGGVYEFTPDGLLMAQYDPLANLRGVHELSNGHLLVTNSDGVHEITRQNEFVRTIVTGDARHITAIRRPNLSFTPRTLRGEVIEGAAAQGSFTMQNSTPEPLSFAFTELPAFIAEISPTTGLLPAEGTIEVSVTFDGTDVPPGTHHGTITVQTDEPENNLYIYHVLLAVNGISSCVIEPDPVVFGEVIVGFHDTMPVSVVNLGSAPCILLHDVTEGDDFSTTFPQLVAVAPGESLMFDVIFAPTAAGPITGTLRITSNDGDVTADLAGTGVAPPNAAVEPSQLHFNVVAGAMASAAVSLSNQAAAGSADLEYSVLVAASRPAGQLVSPRPTGIPGAFPGTGASISVSEPGPYMELTGSPATYRGGIDAVTITHSADTSIPYSPSPVGCSNWYEMYYARANQYWRVFDLSQFEVDEELIVTSVDVGVWMSHGTNPPLTSVRLYTLDGDLHTSNLTLVAETELQITAAHNLQLATAVFPGGVTFSADDVLVVEWAIPDGQPGSVFAGHHTLAGQNAAGETGPTYFSAAACDRPQPTALTALGFPDRHWVLLVHGTSGPALVSVGPSEGTVSAGSAAELTVTVDTEGVEMGTYDFEVLIQTNDPASPLLVVEVEVVIGESQAPPQAHGAPMAIGFELDASANASSWQMLTVSNLAAAGSAALGFAVTVSPVGSAAGRIAPVDMVTVDPSSGVVEGGQSMEIMVIATCDEDDEPGAYAFELLVQTTDPATPQFVVHVDVVVTGAVSSDGDGPPFVFALEPNRPNPFSGTTQIEYELAEASAVRIDVYDLAGRRVETLVNRELEAGRHTVAWDARGVAAGVYFYRIQAGSFTQTMRALVVR